MAAKRGVRLTLSLPRRFSIAAAAEEKTSTQTAVPIILAPHVIKKAYTVHPTTRCFEPLLKYQWLTKTTLHEGLPLLQNIGDLVPSEELGSVKRRAEELAVQSLGFQKEGRKKKERVEEEVRCGLLQGLLGACWALSGRFPHLKSTYLDHEPRVTTHWVRKQHFYQTEHRPAWVLRSQQPCRRFLQDVAETIPCSLPGPYDNYSMGLFRHPIVHLRNCPGHHKDAWNLYPHSHTMLLTNSTSRHPDEVRAQGVMTMFSMLAAMAREGGVLLGQHLETPLATKCVITNGVQFTFMCYQLNTLSLQQDDGIKNCAWASETMDIFKGGGKIKSDNQRGLHGTISVKGNQPSFDESCIELLLTFLCQQPDI